MLLVREMVLKNRKDGVVAGWVAGLVAGDDDGEVAGWGEPGGGVPEGVAAGMGQGRAVGPWLVVNDKPSHRIPGCSWCRGL